MKSVGRAVRIASVLVFGFMFDVDRISVIRKKKAEPARQDGAICIAVWLKCIMFPVSVVGVRIFMARFVEWIVSGVRIL